MLQDCKSLGSVDPPARSDTGPTATGHEPGDTQTVVLTNGPSFTFHAPSCPIIAEFRAESCSLLVRRCPDARHLVYGSRFTRSIRTAAYEADVWMTDLLIAIRATAHQLGRPRLLERVIDRLPSFEWSLVEMASDDATDSAITVRRYIDGRHVVYGGTSVDGRERSAFRVSGPMAFRLKEDVRLLAVELGLERLARQLLAKLH